MALRSLYIHEEGGVDCVGDRVDDRVDDCRPGADRYYIGVRSGMRMTHLYHIYIASFLLDQSTHEFHRSTQVVSVACSVVSCPRPS